MKTRKKFYFSTLGVLIIGTSPARAASLFSEVIVGQGDRFSGTGELPSSNTGQPVAVTNYTRSYDFSGLSGTTGDTLVFSGSGDASAVYQRLRASASGSVNNTYYDLEYNYDNGTGEIPIQYGVQSIAKFDETLQYGGTAFNYTSRYILRFTGVVTESDIYNSSHASISLTHGASGVQSWYFDQPGNYDVILTSDAFVHGASPQEFSLQLLTAFDVFTDEVDNGSNFTGSASFGNTLEVIGIDLRDDAGNLLIGDSVTGDGGGAYTITGVPEPSTIALLMISASAILRRKR